MFEEEGDFNLGNIFIKIGLVSPEVIRSWSMGIIKKPETINYRSLRPERDGLFCERIFGPTRDYECFCGKYKSMRYRGVVCDRCGVEVIKSQTRRERMGHIELAAPVSHIWYVKRIPSPMALLLDISNQELEEVLYFDSWLVLDVEKDVPLKKYSVLSDIEYHAHEERYPEGFKGGMGAEAVKEVLAGLDLKKLAANLRKALQDEKSAPKRRKTVKRLDIIESFLSSRNKPEWMILDAIPVIPPDLRPMVQLDGGRFATSDLNDLYRRVINRNNRLERLVELRAPDVIMRNEKRMLQEAVDALFDNGRRGKPVTTANNRPLKALSDILKGKQGRFRQNLLGKRVDYSGRSVIVVDPNLRLYQCGLPKRMAIELFKPFIMRRLVATGSAHNIKSAKRLIEREAAEIWDALDEITKNHPILLNRAPTLHRASIQAFVPVLVDGESLKIHPMVCAAFNADFDGDQMAVHIPLSLEAQLEARILMLSAHNLISSSSGSPLIAPTQDIVLGICYLTKEKKNVKGEGRIFKDRDEAISLYETKDVSLHALVKIGINGKLQETTVGRLIFNEIVPKEIGYINQTLNKGFLAELVNKIYTRCGVHRALLFLDEIKTLGYKFATRSACSIAMVDMKIPERKEKLLSASFKRQEKIQAAYQKGLITDEERYNQVIDVWTSVGEDLAKMLFDELSKDRDGFNTVYLMMDSGARGSKQQVRQLGGMRGLMAKPSGEIIELPITSNFREGLSVLEYFISTHGARKGLTDTALKTADAGYLTRRLVDVSQDVIICIEDCKTINGIIIESIKEGDEIIVSLANRVLGRVCLEDVIDPMTGELIVKENQEITNEIAEKIDKAEVERIKIRSVLTCEAEKGICSKCYGWDLSTQKLVDLGETVGIIAGQSIGEPGTQLTMRTFHIGGTAHRAVREAEIKFDYPVRIIDLPKRLVDVGNETYISLREGNITIAKTLFSYSLSPEAKPVVHEGFWVNIGERIVQKGNEFIQTPVRGTIKFFKDVLQIVSDERKIHLKTGGRIFVKQGQLVEAGKKIADFDPYNEPILTEVSGKVKFVDIISERTLREELDENTGYFRRTIISDREGQLQPIILIESNGQITRYILPNGARLVVEDSQDIKAGDIIAKFPQEFIYTKDITGGLPRVVELFEARRPKDAAILSEIDGVVSFKETEGLRTRIIEVKNETTEDIKEYSVSMGKHLKVHPGDRVKAGNQLVEGPIDPHDILRIEGEKRLHTYLLNEVQEVYRLQDVDINDKHIEVIIRQMLRKIKITDSGETGLLPGDQVDRVKFKTINEKARREGKKQAQGRLVLLGITKASLATDSFISAASFQETTRVLTEAAIEGKTDSLSGLKENVIIGRLIPAGTGYREHIVEETQKI